MSDGPLDVTAVSWRDVGTALTRPYRVTVPMVVFVCLVPVYLVIAGRGDVQHAPATALDGLFPVIPVWALIYGALYAFLIILPVLVVQQDALIRRTVSAYLTVWLVSYAFFVFYPTAAPRPETVAGDGFAAWGLRTLYESDPPYNCFPSIHVAHSFVSALAAGRVNRRLGLVALACAALVALSTLFTKQHYVADVTAGILLATLAYLIFLRSYPRPDTPAFDRRVAPPLAACAAAVSAAGIACFWAAYTLGFLE